MSTDPRVEAAKESVADSLSEVVYTCSRSWDAWHYGTMTDEDFSPAWEDDTLVGEIAAAAIAEVDKAAAEANNVELGGLYRNELGAELIIASQVVVLHGIRTLGSGLYAAESRDELFGITDYLVTADSLRAAGYEHIGGTE